MPQPLDPLVAELVDRFDPEDREWFEERAGSIEFEARCTRTDAERPTLLMLLRRFPAALTRVTVLQVEFCGETRWALTTDVRRALQVLADRAVAEIRAADLSEVLQMQFAGVAFIGAR